MSRSAAIVVASGALVAALFGRSTAHTLGS